MPPLVMNTFWPLITQSPFLWIARVFIDDTSEPASGAVGLLEEIGPVEPHLGRLLDDRPWEFLGLVVLVRDRPDLLLGEAVHPVPDFFLFVAQLERNHVSGS